MTTEALKRLHALNKEIEYEKGRLFSMRSVHDHIGICGVGSLKKSDFQDEISLLEAKITLHLKECLALYNEIIDFINTVPDPLLRLIISLRYINALEWEQIAMHIGGGNTAESVRKSCERYLKRRLSK